MEEDVVRETAPGGVVQQSIQQSAQRHVAEILGQAEEDLLKEAGQRGVEQDFLREAALLPVNELLAREELPRRIADVCGSEEAQELISQDPSLQTPPCRIAKEPLWLFGLEIQRGHPRDGTHPWCIVPEKEHLITESRAQARLQRDPSRYVKLQCLSHNVASSPQFLWEKGGLHAIDG
jgi:hypothetical protein